MVLFTSQIERALTLDEHAGRNFVGVFPCNKLPREITSYPSSVVANTDPEGKPGTHWIAFYFDELGHLDYFDSYGKPPDTYPYLTQFAANNGVSVSFNDRQLQALTSDVCGYYCISFVGMRSRGHSLPYIMEYYSGDGTAPPGAYDDKVRSEVTRLYDIKRVEMRGSGHYARNYQQQCCRPAVVANFVRW